MKKVETASAAQLQAASALARQNREVVIPEVDAYVYGVMCTGAGNKPTAKALTNTNIYTEILAASQALDDAEVPETGRVLVVTPAIYVLMKQCKDIIMETNVGNELRLQGVIGILDGMNVQKIPAAHRAGGGRGPGGQAHLERPGGGVGPGEHPEKYYGGILKC